MNSSITHPQRLLVISFMLIFGCGGSTPSPAPPPPGAPQPPQTIRQEPAQGQYDGIVIAVAHDQSRDMSPADIHAWGRAGHVLYDIKSLLPANQVDGRL